MWRVAKSENSSVVVAVAESWDWIHYLVEKEIVDFNYNCAENDSLCGQEISYNYSCFLDKHHSYIIEVFTMQWSVYFL